MPNVHFAVVLLALTFAACEPTRDTGAAHQSERAASPSKASFDQAIEDREAALQKLRDARMRRDIVGAWTYEGTAEIGDTEPGMGVLATYEGTLTFRTDGTFEDVRQIAMRPEGDERSVFEFEGRGTWRIDGGTLYGSHAAERMEPVNAAARRYLSTSPTSSETTHRLGHEFEWGRMLSLEGPVLVIERVADVPLPVDMSGRNLINMNHGGRSEAITYRRR